MKHKGNHFEYRDERDADPLRAYRQHIVTCDVIDIRRISQEVVNMPASRFWVSEERAIAVMRRMKKHRPLHGMRPLIMEMYHEIYRRVLALEMTHPDWSLFKVVFHVIRQPAPKFYLTAESARVIMYKAKKRKKHRKEYEKVVNKTIRRCS